MRKCTAFLIILIVGLFNVTPTFAQDTDGKWEKTTESNGIIGYSRPTSMSGYNEIKAVGIVDAPIAAIEAVLRDEAAKPEYTYMCSDGFKVDIPGLKNTKDSYYSYHRVDMPWPFYDRDLVSKVDLMIDRGTGSLLINIHSISSDFDTGDRGVVRAPFTVAKWILTPKGENKTEVLYQVLADPGVYIPAFLVNMFSKGMGVKTIQGLREIVKKDKYRKAKSIVTTTPWIR